MSTVPTWNAGGLRRLIIVLVLLAAAPVVAGILLVRSITQPPSSKDTPDPSELLLRAEEASVVTSDGVHLASWFIRGRSGAPPIILCHDLGGTRGDLLNAAVILNKAGYPLLLLDFRRHGGSGAARSTLGAEERLDVLAAVQYLRGRKDVDGDRIGGWGVGMGAYALALAASEAEQVQALALDSLYPDVSTQVDRLVRQNLPSALHLLVPALHLLYNPFFRCRLDKFAVKDRLPSLAGRSLLLIAASETPDRFEEQKVLYQALPEGPEGAKNLLELRRSGLGGLYAEDRTRYDQTILGFFASYLAPDAAGKGGKTIEVLER
jgi:pimeloyl-ACP methyl ester carboxylesterase